jgi:hypothetical protein
VVKREKDLKIMIPRSANRQFGQTRNDNLGCVGLLAKRGQGTLETAILFLVIVFAFVAMQVYIKRAVQGRLRGDADSIAGQYDFERTAGNMTTRRGSHTRSAIVTSEQSVTDPETGWAADRQVTTMSSETLGDWSNTSGAEMVGPP